jgi:transcription initiation factor IIE alpha subunit
MTKHEVGPIWVCPMCGEQLDPYDREAESPNDHVAFHELADRLHRDERYWP